MPFFSIFQGPAIFVLVVLVLALSIQLVYYYFVFLSLTKYKKAKAKIHKEGVSIVVCSKNDIEFLKKHLDSLLNQDYPDFEVIVVNDGSWDGTKAYLDRIQIENPKLKPVHLDKDRNHTAGKKFALTMGIKAAKNEYLLLIDADCKPASNKWVSTMMNHFEEGIDVVLGFSPYKTYYGVLNLFIRYETLFVGMQFLSLAMKNRPYMGVGRNMAYKKSVFLENKGFASNINIAAGDDDLLIQTIANKNNTSICIDAESHTVSEPHRRIGKWWNQKMRHLNVGTHYKAGIKWILGIFSFSFLFFYLSLIALFVLQIPLEYIAILFGIRIILTWIPTFICYKKLNNAWLAIAYPFLDIFYFIYYIILGPISLFRNKDKW